MGRVGLIGLRVIVPPLDVQPPFKGCVGTAGGVLPGQLEGLVHQQYRRRLECRKTDGPQALPVRVARLDGRRLRQRDGVHTGATAAAASSFTAPATATPSSMPPIAAEPATVAAR